MIRAISVRAPWAQCIAIGAKAVENRGRRAAFRGELAIHASRTVDGPATIDPRVVGALGTDPMDGAVLGAIIAVAELIDAHPAEATTPGAACCPPWGELFYSNGLAVHLVLANARMLRRPVPCRGALPIGWLVPAEVEEQVRAQLVEVAR